MSLKKFVPDNGRTYIQTGKEQQVNSFRLSDIQYSTFGKFILFRLLNNRDVKIVITSKGKTTGTGKTTLAILIAKWINDVRNELFTMDKDWSAKQYAFMDVWDYLESYDKADKGDVLITDELEVMADRRRHATHQNVKFSQAWSMLRYKNVITIGTAPGLMDLEKRIPEGADIWINVVVQGRANTYYMTVDDFEWTMEYKRLKAFGFRESLLWDPLDNDPDYQWLKDEKEGYGVPGVDDMDRVDKSDITKAKKKTRKGVAQNLIKFLSDKNILDKVKQEEIADVTGYSQQQISKLKRDLEKDGNL